MNPLPPGRTRRAPAPELSAEEREVVARFDAASPLGESGAVVRAMLALAEEFDAYINWREWGVGNRIRAALSAALAADPEPLP